MGREVVLDTETTGLDPHDGHRIVEIGAIELVNHVRTDRKPFHVYINPERPMPEEAFKVHGLSDAFLADKPKFPEVADAFMAFIDGAHLVIHNAGFDMKFINAELEWLERSPVPMDRVIDTLAIARRKFPGSPASLDALCRRFGVDNTDRTLHGALIDSDLLAQVYMELLGGRQQGLALAVDGAKTETSDATRSAGTLEPRLKRPRTARPHGPSAAEETAHRRFVTDDVTASFWLEPASENILADDVEDTA